MVKFLDLNNQYINIKHEIDDAIKNVIIEDLKKIDLSWNRNKIEKHIKATLMKGFEPPYFKLNGKKIYFLKEYIDD
jgi:hypothetical protein